MKKFAKIFASVTLIASMAMSLAGCALTDAKNAGDEIMGLAFELKGSKVTKYFNEDDKKSDEQCASFEDIINDFEKQLELEFEDVTPKANKVAVKNDEATLDYKILIGDGEYEFTLNLEQDGDDWVIADNEEFSVQLYTLFFDIVDDEGSKSQKAFIKEARENVGVKNNEKLAQAIYDSYFE